MTRLNRRRFLGATAGVVGTLTVPRITVGRENPIRVRCRDRRRRHIRTVLRHAAQGRRT
jgi:hypothetical protein